MKQIHNFLFLIFDVKKAACNDLQAAFLDILKPQDAWLSKPIDLED